VYFLVKKKIYGEGKNLYAKVFELGEIGLTLKPIFFIRARWMFLLLLELPFPETALLFSGFLNGFKDLGVVTFVTIPQGKKSRLRPFK